MTNTLTPTYVFTSFDMEPPNEDFHYEAYRGIEVIRFAIDDPVQFDDMYEEFDDKELLDRDNVVFYFPEPEEEVRLGLQVVRSGVLREAYHKIDELPEQELLEQVTLGGLVAACKAKKDSPSPLVSEAELTFDRFVKNYSENTIYLNLKPSPETASRLAMDVQALGALLTDITGRSYALRHSDFSLLVATITRSRRDPQTAEKLAGEIEGIVRGYLPDLKGIFAKARYAATPEWRPKGVRRILAAAS